MEARELNSEHYSVWHAWAVANYDQLKKVDTSEVKSTNSIILNLPPKSPVPLTSNAPFMSPKGGTKLSYITPRKPTSINNLLSIQQVDSVSTFVVNAIKGFVNSIVLGQGQPVANVLQDTLRLLTLWFSYGTKKGVFQILDAELDKISPENWLSVVPQLIARIHLKSPEISGLLRKLLTKVAATHPQALVCPISVALNTSDPQQKLVATDVLHEMRKLCSQLVEEATMVILFLKGN
jgi:FKBP12-rapamycin complex-associated protein